MLIMQMFYFKCFRCSLQGTSIRRLLDCPKCHSKEMVLTAIDRTLVEEDLVGLSEQKVKFLQVARTKLFPVLPEFTIVNNK